MLQKDIEMSRILYRKDLSADVKQKLNHVNLEHYLNLKRQNDSTASTVKLASNIDLKEEKVLPQEKEQLSDSVIVENIPKSMRPRAVVLLNRLKARPDVILWDETGKVNLDGVSVSQSNISDLISDAIRRKNILTPLAQRNFFKCCQGSIRCEISYETKINGSKLNLRQ